jgi:hypothetical protein
MRSLGQNPTGKNLFYFFFDFIFIFNLFLINRGRTTKYGNKIIFEIKNKSLI